MQSYEEMIRETDKMIKEIMYREQIWLYVLMGITVLLAVFAVVVCVLERREIRKARAEKVVGGNVYTPMPTDDVQVVNGVEFHRMGVPGFVRSDDV